MIKSWRKPLLYVLMIVVAILQFFPLLWLILISVKSNEEIANGDIFGLPAVWRFSNYTQAWSSAHIGEYFYNSVYVTVVTLIFVLLFSSMMAYALTRMRFKLNGFVMILLLMGIMVPIHATLIPLFIMMKNMGILSSLWAVILPYIAVNLPVGVFILSGFLRSMPKELEEAAFLDGCGVFQSFFRVVLPTLKPVLASVSIFTFLAVWNELLMAVTFIQKSAMRTLPFGLMSFSGEYSIDWGPLAAAMVISTIPLLITFIFFSEQMEKSFTAGAILK